MSDSSGTCSFGSVGAAMPTNPAPISALNPRPKMVSARPVAIWLAIIVRVRKPNASAINVPRDDRGQHAQRRDSGRMRDGKAGDRTDQHHALNAEVQHAGPFGDEFAGGRKQQRRCRRDNAEQRIDQQANSSRQLLQRLAPGGAASTGKGSECRSPADRTAGRLEKFPSPRWASRDRSAPRCRRDRTAPATSPPNMQPIGCSRPRNATMIAVKP